MLLSGIIKTQKKEGVLLMKMIILLSDNKRAAPIIFE
jgi:hypothetical protein